MELLAAKNSDGIRLREICGADEQRISDTDTRQAVALLQALAASEVGDTSGVNAIMRLSSWDRDCLLATLYAQIYGPRVASSLHCDQCTALFDLDFDLYELMGNLAPEQCELPIEFVGGGKWRWNESITFRLPTVEDECAVAELPAFEAEARLLARCVEDADALDDATSRELQQLMQALSPVVNLDLDARCPECGNEQQIRFDLQRYLLASLVQDRQQLTYEIHALASAYGWSLSEILQLPRTQRRSLVARVESDDTLQRMGA